ncbi:MAG: reverse transcriptase family protein, partial [Pirellulales bacterium]|nr:reverse transcriptase family protein [Pirellulales bacterium]
MTTRQELYDRIGQSSKDEVILEEMIRLGYWPRGGTLPEDPADEIRQRGELERELRALTSENRRLKNASALKKELRKKRLEESRRKRQETKQRRLRERAERAAAWKEKQKTEIIYLGDGVSAGLNSNETDQAKLQSLNLPMIRSASELAQALGITLGELRFLAYDRRTSKVTHYRRFAVAKKSGGQRLISAPMPRLKRTQEWILAHILQQIELHRAAHGFRVGRSIITNAQPHVGSEVVINLDMENFFPTITYRRVKGVFRSFGYGEAVSTILSLLCCEPEAQPVRLDGGRYFVSRSERKLPQGAPTSPALTNVICRGLDARLAGIAQQLGGRYTRYADDITMSFPDASANVGVALRRIEFVVQQEGFKVHPGKTRIQRKGSHQEVTGLTVNERVSVPRPLLRRFRATLFQIEKDGPAGKQWGKGQDVIASIEGFANFVRMVDESKGAELKQRVEAIIQRHGRGHAKQVVRRRWQPRLEPAQPESVLEEKPATTGSAKMSDYAIDTTEVSGRPTVESNGEKKPWWKFW